MKLFKQFGSRSKGTAVIMLNMGGPKTANDVKPFLKSLFQDTDLLQLPFQKYLGNFIATTRTPKLIKHYENIGGSPIEMWTNEQGKQLTKLLDEKLKSSAPHRHYVGFRYIAPRTQEAVEKAIKDGNDRFVFFSQYQHYSCSTSGSSFNDLTEVLEKQTKKLNFSYIDRWGSHPAYIDSVTETVEEAAQKLLDKGCDPSRIFVLFTGHALPLDSVIRGDTYVSQVATTVELVMSKLSHKYSYRLSWQSQVGPSKWFGARTDRMLELAATDKANYDGVVLVPITFTSDHIETLYELDLELIHDIIKEHGENALPIERAPSLNARPTFIKALASIFSDHMVENKKCTPQFKYRYHECVNMRCKRTREFLFNYQC